MERSASLAWQCAAWVTGANEDASMEDASMEDVSPRQLANPPKASSSPTSASRKKRLGEELDGCPKKRTSYTSVVEFTDEDVGWGFYCNLDEDMHKDMHNRRFDGQQLRDNLAYWNTSRQ